MAVLYILQSTSSGRSYIGSAADLACRLSEHGRQHSPYTRRRGPWTLVYQEHYETLCEARRRERQLKSWKSHRSIWELSEAAKLG